MTRLRVIVGILVLLAVLGIVVGFGAVGLLGWLNDLVWTVFGTFGPLVITAIILALVLDSQRRKPLLGDTKLYVQIIAALIATLGLVSGWRYDTIKAERAERAAAEQTQRAIVAEINALMSVVSQLQLPEYHISIYADPSDAIRHRTQEVREDYFPILDILGEGLGYLEEYWAREALLFYNYFKAARDDWRLLNSHVVIGDVTDGSEIASHTVYFPTWDEYKIYRREIAHSTNMLLYEMFIHGIAANIDAEEVEATRLYRLVSDHLSPCRENRQSRACDEALDFVDRYAMDRILDALYNLELFLSCFNPYQQRVLLPPHEADCSHAQGIQFRPLQIDHDERAVRIIGLIANREFKGLPIRFSRHQRFFDKAAFAE